MKLKIFAVITCITLIFCGCAKTENEKVQVQANDTCEVYFIDVGQADCSLVVCGGQSMLIDGGNVEDGDLICDFLRSKKIETIDFVVATHAHEDHIGGLSKVIDTFKVNQVFSPTDKYSSACFKNFKNSADKQCGITLCSAGYLWSIGEALVSALWPEDDLADATNNTSIVLRMTFGNVAFMFTGDAEKEVESELVSSEYLLSANVLKVGHHGSSSSTSYAFLREVMPQFAVISCGKGNSYGHPHTETLDILSQAEAQILRTDEVGSIHFSTDGETITVSTDAETVSVPAQTALPALESDNVIIGNKKSKKYHTPECKNLPKEESRVYFATAGEAEQAGFTPCSACNK